MVMKILRALKTPGPAIVALSFLLSFSCAQAQTLPSETPKDFKPTNDGFEYVRRDVMIPMRDGVKLHAVIIVPKGAQQCADTSDAHAVRRNGADQSRQQFASRPNPQRL